MGEVELIMTMGVEAGHIATRAIVQSTTAVRRPPGSGGWMDKAAGGQTGERATSSRQKCTPGRIERSTHAFPGHLCLPSL
jgi:hypothetical protein